MAPSFVSEVIKDNSHYLTKINSHVLLALDIFCKVSKSSSFY